MFSDISSKYQFSSFFGAFENKLDGMSVLFTVVPLEPRLVVGPEEEWITFVEWMMWPLNLPSTYQPLELFISFPTELRGQDLTHVDQLSYQHPK